MRENYARGVCVRSDDSGRLAPKTGGHPTKEDSHDGRHEEGAGHQAGREGLAGLSPARSRRPRARARQAQQEARAGIDSAVERIRDVRKDLGTRAQSETDDLQARLEHASEDARRELGRAAIRAQRTPEALTQMQAEIRDRKRKLSA